MVEITANCDAALRRLRDLNEPRVLWIDAICINQEDQSERSLQIGIMQDIYANATQVLVWLGRASKEDLRAIPCLKDMPSRLEDKHAPTYPKTGWYRDSSGKLFFGGASWSMLTNIEYQHLTALLRRDWFRRTWVIQEVASSKSAIVLCGDQEIPWDTLADVYVRLGDLFLPVDQLGGEDAHYSLENITAIERARRSRSGPLSMSLFHILVATSFSECKDPRDKIFAVVGLAKDWLEKKILKPDYNTIPKEEAHKTFKDFAAADINHYKHLAALSCASGPSSELPSWVPDWSNIDNAHPFTRYSDRTGFCASGAMKPEAWLSDDHTTLHVMGKHVDSIGVLGPMAAFTKAIAVYEIDDSKISKIKHSLKWLRKCEDLARDRSGMLSTERQNQLSRTLMCGLTGEGFPASIESKQYFDEYLGLLSRMPERLEGYMKDAAISDKAVRGLDEVVDPHSEMLFESSLSRWSSRRRFSVTQNGRLACVPKDSRKGDLLCVLFGGEVPYVLRPSGNGYYAIVGECYVDGIMHGEGLSADTMSKVFRLR